MVKTREVGRKKLNQATRYLTIVLGVAQSMGITAGFNSLSNWDCKQSNLRYLCDDCSYFNCWDDVCDLDGWTNYRKRNRKWCFNDYLCGIISRLRGAVKEIYEDYFVNIESSRIWQSVIFIAILVIAILVIVTVVTFFQQAERKIPIQYTKRVSGAPTSSYLPLKVNAAGVIQLSLPAR